IERHLTGHPVQARGDSLSYRTAKFVQRNQIAVGGGIAGAAALVRVLVFAMRGERRALAGEKHATEQALHARAEAKSFQNIADFLVSSFLMSASTLNDVDREARGRRVQSYAAQLRRRYSGPSDQHLRANL